VAHRNAPLTELGRLRLARCIIDQGWPEARAAERFQVSRPTAHRWAIRYRDQGAAGMTDRSSRPHHSPGRTPTPLVRKIVHLRWHQRLGPAQIAPQVGLAPRRSMPFWSAAGSAALDTWTGPPASRSAATSTPIPAPWSTSMSRSWATSPLVAVTGSWAGLLGAVTAKRIAPAARPVAIATR
jgi:leucine-zipper of insertion element IS481